MHQLEKLFQGPLNNEVYNTGQIKLFPAGMVILNINAYIKSIPIVIKGSLKVMQADVDGKEILLYYIKPGESCIMSILAGMHNNKSKIKAIVEEDAEILLIPVEKIAEWLRVYPEWAEFIFTLYQKRFEELLDVVIAVAFQKVDSRLLHLLKQKSALFQSKEINTTHLQLALELGISREAASRVLKQLEKDKLLTLSRNKITLL